MRTGRRTAKGVAGYDVTGLIVGSEGSLAVVTEITLALVPARETALTAVGTFPTLAAAARAAAAVRSSGVRPSLLELLDPPSIEAITRYRDVGLPRDAGAVLLIQSDRGPRSSEDMAAFTAAFRSVGAREVYAAGDAVEADLLMEARRLLGPALTAMGHMLVDDVCVPLATLATLVDGVAEIGNRHQLQTVCPGHAGDGNLHPTVLFDPADADQTARAQAVFDEIMALGLALGGTITGEHGVGLLKRDWLHRELGPEMVHLQRGLKSLFDPNAILNPGKVL